MSEYTKKLQLKKPTPEDFYNVEDFNENMDKIDALTPEDIGAVGIAHAKNVDIDTLIKDGVYRLGEHSSVPSNLHFGTLLVMNGADSETYSQIGVSYAHSVMMFRGGIMSNGTVQWGAWKRTADTDTAAPKSLIYGRVYITTTNEEINSTLMGLFSSMGDGEIRNYIANVNANGLMFAGGAWLATIYKATADYGTIFMHKYETPSTTIRVCSIYKGVMGNWEKITPSGVLNATVE